MNYSISRTRCKENPSPAINDCGGHDGVKAVLTFAFRCGNEPFTLLQPAPLLKIIFILLDNPLSFPYDGRKAKLKTIFILRKD